MILEGLFSKSKILWQNVEENISSINMLLAYDVVPIFYNNTSFKQCECYIASGGNQVLLHEIVNFASQLNK
jgi:hypothetical protein